MLKSTKVNWLKNNEYLSVYGSDEKIYARFEATLGKIETTDIGNTLLKSINNEISRKKSMYLVIHLDATELEVTPHCYIDACNSKGTGSNFYCALDKVKLATEQGIDQKSFDACKVFHELIHVLNNLKGTRFVNNLEGKLIDIKSLSSEAESHIIAPPLLEEARTVGLGIYSEELFSENTFRKEIGAPRRTDYAHESCIIHDDNTVTQGFVRKKLLPQL